MRPEIDVMDSIKERIEAQGFDALTDAERYYYAIWWLEAENSNGTFDQYFRNASGELAHKALQALKEAGAQRMAEIFEAAISLFPNGQVPREREQRIRILDAFSAQQDEKLEQLSHQFSDYPDDLASLLNTYVEANKQQFLGPTTLLEMWESRRARGADTQPRSLAGWDLDQQAARDALATDRKCPVCGQPAPDYRKTCKRCGYPVGRVTKKQ